MGEKQDEYEEIDGVYTEEKKQLNELEERFKTLEVETTKIHISLANFFEKPILSPIVPKYNNAMLQCWPCRLWCRWLYLSLAMSSIIYGIQYEILTHISSFQTEYKTITEARNKAKEERETAERELALMIKAATTIQAVWRSYKVRKALKSKNKKGKKSKK